jgi:hypothetical protein
MEENDLDEIFLRIQKLEEENRLLKEELNSIENENYFDMTSLTNFTPNDDKVEEMNNFKKLNNIPDTLYNQNSTKLIDIIISYKPYEELDRLEIASDFTGWKKIDMEKVLYL